jgi:hypothetical protein
MNVYDKPPELYDGLRLHQDEHTGGCSPRVLAALASLRPDQVAITAGIVEHTRRGLAVLEEVPCAAR